MTYVRVVVYLDVVSRDAGQLTSPCDPHATAMKVASSDIVVVSISASSSSSLLITMFLVAVWRPGQIAGKER